MRIFFLLFIFLLGKMVLADNSTKRNLTANSINGVWNTESLLENGDFEFGKRSWIAPEASASAEETAIVINGDKSLKITVSSATGDVHQYVTTDSDFVGVQMVASAWVNTSLSTVSVCAVENSLEVGCTPVNADSKWKQYTVPFVGAATNAGVKIKTTAATGSFYVDQAYVGKIPLAATSDLAIYADKVPWRIDATIGGADIDLLGTDQSAYVVPNNGSLTMTPATGSAPVSITCSTTNAPATPTTATSTCPVGNEEPGISFTNPFAGDFLVCAHYSHHLNSPDAFTVVFQLIETTTNSQSIVQEGKTRISSRLDSTVGTIPYSNCGTFVFTDVKQRNIRLAYEQDVNSTPSTNSIRADQSATLGQRDVHYYVIPLSGIQVGTFRDNIKVKTSSNGKPIMESALLNCDSGSAITSQLGAGVSAIGNISSGACTVTLTDFSASPYCTAVATASNKLLNVNVSSASSLSIGCKDVAAGSNADCTTFDANIMCIGAD